MKDDLVHNPKYLDAGRKLVRTVAEHVNIGVNVRLWDGSLGPLGSVVTGPLEISISDPGVIGALLRKPTFDNLIRHYIDKRIDFSGGTIIDIGREIHLRDRSSGALTLSKARLVRRLLPFLTARSKVPPDTFGFETETTGRDQTARDTKAYVQFHYDLSNDFYALFLDPEMVYSCGYFTDCSNDLATAQRDKLDIVCRKLRLKAGETFLDVGSGWGGLVCHAVQKYGVTAYGITLSKAQLDYAREKTKRLGIADRVTFELTDYANLKGRYQKIASVGMSEHVGLKNIPSYMKEMRSLLADDGLFLNHAITRRAPKPSILPERKGPEQKALARYIFPGGELDDIGRTLWEMERAGLEVHDVEGWRRHYARTCEIWCNNLTANREAAIREVGEAKYRIYVIYLGGVSLLFERGTARIFQTLASKSAKLPTPLPLTRAHLYE